jgi:undecaprenyl-diphosphatase
MRRRSSRVLRFIAGAALVTVSYAAVRRGRVPAGEERLFRLANGADDRLQVPVRAIMQAGTFVTVPVAGTIAVLAGRRRLAVRLVVGGSLAWFGAKAIKPIGGRGRPATVLDDVTLREGIEGDLGWVSGHTAVATTLASILADAVPPWTRPWLAGVVAATAFGRMYVGAHLPYDTIGGAGLGMMIGAALSPGRSVDAIRTRSFGTRTSRSS